MKPRANSAYLSGHAFCDCIILASIKRVTTSWIRAGYPGHPFWMPLAARQRPKISMPNADGIILKEEGHIFLLHSVVSHRQPSRRGPEQKNKRHGQSVIPTADHLEIAGLRRPPAERSVPAQTGVNDGTGGGVMLSPRGSWLSTVTGPTLNQGIY